MLMYARNTLAMPAIFDAKNAADCHAAMLLLLFAIILFSMPMPARHARHSPISRVNAVGTPP